MRFGLKKIAKWLIPIIFFSISVGYLIYRFDWQRVSQSSILIPPKEIKGKLITLRELKEDYFFDYHSMFSSTVRKAMEFPESITLDYTIKFLKLEMAKSQEGKQLLYCIFDNKENKLIGAIDIREKNIKDPGQVGCWINENYWGGGRFQEALKLIIQTYFKLHPDQESFSAHVRLWNKRSYNALKKFGFKDVGYYYEDGKPTRYILIYKRN